MICGDDVLAPATRMSFISRNVQATTPLKSSLVLGVAAKSVATSLTPKEIKILGLELKEIAVLFRAANHSQFLEMELNKRGLAYEMRGGLKFFERAHIKDIIAYLRLIVNPKDGISFDRIVNFPARGIGKTTLEKIHARAKAENSSYLSILSNPDKLAVGKNQKQALSFGE